MIHVIFLFFQKKMAFHANCFLSRQCEWNLKVFFFFFFFFIWEKYFKMPSAELFYHAASVGKTRPSHSRIQIIAVALCLHILSWLTNFKQRSSISFVGYEGRSKLSQVGTWRKYNVASTSMQRHDVASTLRRRCIYVMCLPGVYLDTISIDWLSIIAKTPWMDKRSRQMK